MSLIFSALRRMEGADTALAMSSPGRSTAWWPGRRYLVLLVGLVLIGAAASAWVLLFRAHPGAGVGVSSRTFSEPVLSGPLSNDGVGVPFNKGTETAAVSQTKVVGVVRHTGMPARLAQGRAKAKPTGGAAARSADSYKKRPVDQAAMSVRLARVAVATSHIAPIIQVAAIRNRPKSDVGNTSDAPSSTDTDLSQPTANSTRAPNNPNEENLARRHQATRIGNLVGEFREDLLAGNAASAQQILAHLKRLAPENSITLLRVEAFWALKQGDVEKARQRYRSILQRIPGDRSAGLNLSVADWNAGYRIDAREQIQALARQFPDDSTIQRDARMMEKR